MPGPKVAPRPSGGFRSGFGQLGEAHLEESATQAATQQKQQTQQGTSSAQQTTGSSSLQPVGSKQKAAQQSLSQPVKPREVGTIREELLEHPAKDVVKGVKDIFNINTILGINPATDTPEEQAKKKQMLGRWQKLNEEQQQVAKKNFQLEMQKKKQEAEKKEIKKKQEEQAKEASVAPPSTPKKGPVGPGGSKKQRTLDQLEQRRKTLGQTQSQN